MFQNKNPKLRFIAWLLPLTYLLHIIEEYYGGQGLAQWLSDFIGANISVQDFIIINTVAFSLVIVFAVIHSFIKQYNLLLLALTTLFFINGIVHFLSALFSKSYSPGMITGILLYVPMGIIIYKMVKPSLTIKQQKTAFILGLMIHIVVVLVAYNI